jgi:aspartyl-tRNA(Asn)/glutamyl-tRNA(Gln) amidotransferase subunit B
VARAIEHEIGRQIGILDAGGRVTQETRSFDAATGTTWLLRGKEEAHDYRYFPEPDLPAIVLSPERIEAARAALPELPWEKRRRLVSQYGLPIADAGVLVTSRDLAGYFEAAAAGGNPRIIANWVLGEVLRAGLENAIPPARLAALVALVDAGRISNSAAKEVFAAISQSGEEPEAAIERLGLGQVSDAARIERWIDEVVDAHPLQAEQFRAGKEAVLGFLVGQVMKRSGGRADPKLVQALLRQALAQVPAP